MGNRQAPEIKEAREALIKAKKNLENIVLKVRESCTHDIVMEADYVKMNFLSSLPPSRICLNCAFEEDGWGSGWNKLSDREPRLVVKAKDRQEFYKQRV